MYRRLFLINIFLGQIETLKREKREEVHELKNCYEYLIAEVKMAAETSFKRELIKFTTTTTAELKSKEWVRAEGFHVEVAFERGVT